MAILIIYSMTQDGLFAERGSDSLENSTNEKKHGSASNQEHDQFKIYVDAGHGSEPFREGYSRYPESVYEYLKQNDLPVNSQKGYNYTKGVEGEMEVNWQVATKLVDLLNQDERFLVKRDRESKIGPALSNKERALEANEWGADLRISIHADRTGTDGGYFIPLPHEDFVLPESLGGYYTEAIRVETENFAEVLLQALDRSALEYGRWHDGIYRPPGGYVHYNFTKHPVVILEMVNSQNWDDTLKKEAVRDEIAKSIYEAVKEYFQ